MAYTLSIGKGFGKACTHSKKGAFSCIVLDLKRFFYISQTTAKTESVQKARCTDFLYLNSVNKVIWLLNNLISNLENSFYFYIRNGVKTLRTQDTSDPRHFGTIRLVLKCPDSSAPAPKCLQHTGTELSRPPANIFCYNRPYKRKVCIGTIYLFSDCDNAINTVTKKVKVYSYPETQEKLHYLC